MDPVANVREQHELARAIIAQNDTDHSDASVIAEDGVRLAELVQAQAQWCLKGGFDPVTSTTPNQADLIRRLCRGFADRAQAQGNPTGKKRDQLALDYFCGAAEALHQAGTGYNLVMFAFLVGVNGAAEVDRVLAQAAAEVTG